MPANYDSKDTSFVSDKVTINKWAQTEAERRRALKKCMDEHWADSEIGRLERIENSVRWGWQMYSYRPGETGPPKEPG